MIKLVVNPGSLGETLVFQKKTVIIGSESGGAADLSLKSELLQPVHLKIVDDGDKFIIFNVANDPFTTINDLPFGKKILKNHDILQVGRTLISFEGKKSALTKSAADFPILDTEKELVESLEASISRLPIPEPENIFSTAELPSFDVDALIQEVEALETESAEISEQLQEPLPPPERKKEPEPEPLREEVPQKTPLQQEPQERKPFQFTKKWRLALISAIFLLLVLLASIGVYSRLLHISKSDELNAAASTADIALALTFAQLNHIKPTQQNWSDPLFLKTSIAQVLAPGRESLVQINSHGRLLNSPYLLRIYINSDMSHFVIVAHPEAGLTQWLVPKKSIVVDSQFMELRKIDNLKVLHRLLNRSGNLTEFSKNEIRDIVQEGELITLKELAGAHNENGFLPPKSLAYLRPGAENLIYNAPRYSQVGNKLMIQAVKLANRQGTSAEVKQMRAKLSEIEKLPHAVLYTTEGIKTAQAAQKALEALNPNHQYLIAYLKIDPKTRASTSHLVIESDLPITDQEAVHEGTAGHLHLEEVASKPQKDEAALHPEGIDADHPLFLQLAHLTEKRRETLEPISERMIAVLYQENRRPQSHFNERFSALLEQYRIKLEEQDAAAAAEVEKLKKEWHEITPDEFITYVKAAELESLLKDETAKPAEPLPPPFVQKIQEELSAETRFTAIIEAKNWEELEAASKEVSTAISPEEKNLLKRHISHKLEEFILSDSSLPDGEFQALNRVRLSRILRNGSIQDPDERAFFIREFEARKTGT